MINRFENKKKCYKRVDYFGLFSLGLAIYFCVLFFGVYKINFHFLLNDEWRWLVKFNEIGVKEWFTFENLYKDRGGGFIPAYLFIFGFSIENRISPIYRMLAGSVGVALLFFIFVKIVIDILPRKNKIIRIITVLLGFIVFFPITKHVYHNILSFNLFLTSLYLIFFYLIYNISMSSKSNLRSLIIVLSCFSTMSVTVLGTSNLVYSIIFFFLLSGFLIFQYVNDRSFFMKACLIGGFFFTLALGFFLLFSRSAELEAVGGNALHNPYHLLHYVFVWPSSGLSDYIGGDKFFRYFVSFIFFSSFIFFIVFRKKIHRQSRWFWGLFFILISFGMCAAVYVGHGFRKEVFNSGAVRFRDLQFFCWFGWIILASGFFKYVKWPSLFVTLRLSSVFRRFFEGLSVAASICIVILFVNSLRATLEFREVKTKNLIQAYSNPELPCWKRIGFWKPLDESYCEGSRKSYGPIFNKYYSER